MINENFHMFDDFGFKFYFTVILHELIVKGIYEKS